MGSNIYLKNLTFFIEKKEKKIFFWNIFFIILSKVLEKSWLSYFVNHVFYTIFEI